MVPNTCDTDAARIARIAAGGLAGPAGCVPGEGGWYYDVDPQVGESTRITQLAADGLAGGG